MSAGVFNGNFNPLPGGTLNRRGQTFSQNQPGVRYVTDDEIRRNGPVYVDTSTPPHMQNRKPLPNENGSGFTASRYMTPDSQFDANGRMLSRAASLGQRTSPSANPQYLTPTPMQGVAVTPALRQRLTDQATAQARRGALRTAQGTQDYQQGSTSLDDLRNEYQVNEKGIAPDEANARRQKMFADPRYKAASQQVAGTLAPITDAGEVAKADIERTLASVNYLTPGFFDEQQANRDANARANAIGGAQVAGMNAATEAQKFQTGKNVLMLPYDMAQAGIQKGIASAVGRMTPDSINADIEYKKSQAAQNNAKAMQGNADAVNTMTGKNDPRGVANSKAAADASDKRAREAERRNAEMQREIDRLNTLLAKGGIDPGKGSGGAGSGGGNGGNNTGGGSSTANGAKTAGDMIQEAANPPGSEFWGKDTTSGAANVQTVTVDQYRQMLKAGKLPPTFSMNGKVYKNTGKVGDDGHLKLEEVKSGK